MATAKQCKKCGKWFYDNPSSGFCPGEPSDRDLCSECNKEVFITKCPKCGSRKYVLSIFGAICPDCFYKEKAEKYINHNAPTK